MTPQLKQELKELDHYLDALCQQKEKDAGNLWIQFTDKWNSFKKKLAAKEYWEWQGWIKVEEDTPKIFGDYLVSTGDWVGSCHYDGKFYDYSVNKMKASSRYELPVTHWMNLPSSPK